MEYKIDLNVDFFPNPCLFFKFLVTVASLYYFPNDAEVYCTKVCTCITSELLSTKFKTSWNIKSVFFQVISCFSGQKFSSIITHPKVLNSLTFVSTSLMIFYFYRILLWWLLKHDSTLFLPKIIKLFICKGDRNRKLQKITLLKHSLVFSAQVIYI